MLSLLLFLVVILPRPPNPRVFPYTTLFRSPLDGDELMALFGRPPGPWIRPVKEYLLDLVLDGELGKDDRARAEELARTDRKSTRLNSSHLVISYAVFCLKKKKNVFIICKLY